MLLELELLRSFSSASTIAGVMVSSTMMRIFDYRIVDVIDRYCNTGTGADAFERPLVLRLELPLRPNDDRLTLV